MAKLAHIIDAVQCPRCNGESKVIDSRDVSDARRRRRRCEKCSHRYTTYEIHAEEYNRIRFKIDAERVEFIINELRAIKVQFGDSNGHH